MADEPLNDDEIETTTPGEGGGEGPLDSASGVEGEDGTDGDGTDGDGTDGAEGPKDSEPGHEGEDGTDGDGTDGDSADGDGTDG